MTKIRAPVGSHSSVQAPQPPSPQDLLGQLIPDTSSRLTKLPSVKVVVNCPPECEHSTHPVQARSTRPHRRIVPCLSSGSGSQQHPIELLDDSDEDNKGRVKLAVADLESNSIPDIHTSNHYDSPPPIRRFRDWLSSPSVIPRSTDVQPNYSPHEESMGSSPKHASNRNAEPDILPAASFLRHYQRTVVNNRPCIRLTKIPSKTANLQRSDQVDFAAAVEVRVSQNAIVFYAGTNRFENKELALNQLTMHERDFIHQLGGRNSTQRRKRFNKWFHEQWELEYPSKTKAIPVSSAAVEFSTRKRMAPSEYPEPHASTTQWPAPKKHKYQSLYDDRSGVENIVEPYMSGALPSPPSSFQEYVELSPEPANLTFVPSFAAAPSGSRTMLDEHGRSITPERVVWDWRENSDEINHDLKIVDTAWSLLGERLTRPPIDVLRKIDIEAPISADRIDSTAYREWSSRVHEEVNARFDRYKAEKAERLKEREMTARAEAQRLENEWNLQQEQDEADRIEQERRLEEQCLWAEQALEQYGQQSKHDNEAIDVDEDLNQSSAGAGKTKQLRENLEVRETSKTVTSAPFADQTRQLSEPIVKECEAKERLPNSGPKQTAGEQVQGGDRTRNANKDRQTEQVFDAEVTRKRVSGFNRVMDQAREKQLGRDKMNADFSRMVREGEERRYEMELAAAQRRVKELKAKVFAKGIEEAGKKKLDPLSRFAHEVDEQDAAYSSATRDTEKEVDRPELRIITDNKEMLFVEVNEGHFFLDQEPQAKNNTAHPGKVSPLQMRETQSGRDVKVRACTRPPTRSAAMRVMSNFPKGSVEKKQSAASRPRAKSCSRLAARK
ncbi:hypothetical protein FH972_021660 [Carpinus fangiana]|uniref:Uncharacterized protein n=1 Tax=Carpinus fangiana TaxID=176857 RepID=A0A5N6KQ00_9ROSI|nr:hypothetical protein FH972_021660 [Carpinus fangiana]